MSSVSAVLEAAMTLPREARADVARELIASLDDEAPGTPPDVEEAWLAEVETRLAAVDRGEARFEAWEAVEAQISARLRDMRR
jgi:putative addiction module component (TIGR02574 family)